jgi:hypothetical protein
MIFKYFQEPVKVKLPVNFNLTTMRKFISDAVEAQTRSGAKEIYFDFIDLQFIQPEGVVALSNAIEYFRQTRVKVAFANHTKNTEANRYLDDSGFFRQYLKKLYFQTVHVGQPLFH